MPARRILARAATALLLVTLAVASAQARTKQVSRVDQAKATPQVEVLWQGVWWDATIVDEKGARLKIHYIGWDRGWDEWVAPDRWRPADLNRLRAARKGQAVEINWRGGWWPGKVLRARDGRYKISYDNYGSEWDEWVTPDRLRAPHRPVA